MSTAKPQLRIPASEVPPAAALLSCVHSSNEPAPTRSHGRLRRSVSLDAPPPLPRAGQTATLDPAHDPGRIR